MYRASILLLLTLSAWADQPIVRALDGRWQPFEAVAVHRVEASRHFVKDGIAVTISYQDVDAHNGRGFDDPALGATRRATLEAVVAYVCGALNNDGALDLLVLSSLSSASGPLAEASPLFSPNQSFQGGAAYLHITSGVDPFPGSPDAQVVVNFGYPFNSGTDAPGADEYDLYSILLHELTHGLGMLSGLDANGQATILTHFDAKLYTGSGAKVLDRDGNLQVPASALVGGDQGIVFRGKAVNRLLGAGASVYAPAQFNSSSLSHWSSGTGAAVMQPSIFMGTSQRSLAAYELGMLADLGYSTDLSYDLVYPWVSNSADFESAIIVNNPGNREVLLSFTARRADGSSASNSSFTVAPHGFFQKKAAELFPSLGQGPGYTVTLTSSEPDLIGTWVTFDRAAQTPSQGIAVARSLRPTERSGAYLGLGFLPGNAQFQSAPVLINLGETETRIDVYFFDAEGSLLETLTFPQVQPLRPQIVTVVGASAGDRYAVASAAQGLQTGAVFVFNSQNQTAIGNTTSLAEFEPPTP